MVTRGWQKRFRRTLCTSFGDSSSYIPRDSGKGCNRGGSEGKEMTEKQIRNWWWFISAIGMTLMVICFALGHNTVAFPILLLTLIVRYAVTRRWYPNKPN